MEVLLENSKREISAKIDTNLLRSPTTLSSSNGATSPPTNSKFTRISLRIACRKISPSEKIQLSHWYSIYGQEISNAYFIKEYIIVEENTFTKSVYSIF